MQTHISSTPFGRRPMTLGLLASQVATKQMPAEATAHKWQVFQTIREAREAIGATDRGLAILNALLTFHPDTTLAADGSLVVWPSNEHLKARANGMSPATLRRHLANLVMCGLIIRRDSPNGKRFARKGQGGLIEQAYGFDLSPIVARAEEFRELADAIKAEKHAFKVAKERLSLCRRDVVKLIETGVEEGVPGNWEAFRTRYRLLIDDLPRTVARQTLESVSAALELLREEVSKTLELFIKSENMNANESHSDRHIHNSEPEPIYESEQSSGDKKEESGKAADIDNVRSLPKRELPLGIVLDACPEIRLLGDRGEIRTWRDLQAAAGLARPSLGISSSAWEEAQVVLGVENAAITVSAIYERAAEISNAGGYLRSLTERARVGQFSPWPMVMALLRKKMKQGLSAEAGANVRSFDAGSAEKGAHDEKHFEASDALRRSIAKKRWDR